MTLYVIHAFISNLMKIKVLITAGPTRAYLDEVRYISNFSTGALGYLLAKELVRRGAEVSVVAGPTAQPFEKLKLKQYISVKTNEEMLHAVLKVCRLQRPHWAVFAAAVLDFVPTSKVKGKVSSRVKTWTLSLQAAPKIIDRVKSRYPKIKRIGFKLEWEEKRGEKLQSFAQDIIKKRRLEYLVVNFLREVGEVQHFAKIFDKNLQVRVLRTKQEIARFLAASMIAS